MKKLIVAIPHSHAWFWLQTCVTCLRRFPPKVVVPTKGGYDSVETEIVVVDNSPWSPAIRGLTDTELGEGLTIIPNHKSNKFHASALDCIVENFEFDFLMALETDVMVLREDWLQWFMDQLRVLDYGVGMWHHEQFINPSCTLYRGSILRKMLDWCREGAPQDELRWGQAFSLTAPLDNNLPLNENPATVLQNMKGWISGPFAEKRGWPDGTVLVEQPSGQLKGPGWYEPGQQLHHWAVDNDYTYTVCPSSTTHVNGTPVQTTYGTPATNAAERQLWPHELFDSGSYAAHLWGGTRALDILKHPVTCEFVKTHTPGWLAREAGFWLEVVPESVREYTLELIRHYGWHYTGQGTPKVTERDREAADYVRKCYEIGGVVW